MQDGITAEQRPRVTELPLTHPPIETQIMRLWTATVIKYQDLSGDGIVDGEIEVATFIDGGAKRELDYDIALGLSKDNDELELDAERARNFGMPSANLSSDLQNELESMVAGWKAHLDAKAKAEGVAKHAYCDERAESGQYVKRSGVEP